MARKPKDVVNKERRSAALGFEAPLWAMADKQRGHMDAAEYKHVVVYLYSRRLNMQKEVFGRLGEV